jgi:hypothetical protein
MVNNKDSVKYEIALPPIHHKPPPDAAQPMFKNATADVNNSPPPPPPRSVKKMTHDGADNGGNVIKPAAGINSNTPNQVSMS